jgi:hypothetical protein
MAFPVLARVRNWQGPRNFVTLHAAFGASETVCLYRGVRHIDIEGGIEALVPSPNRLFPDHRGCVRAKHHGILEPPTGPRSARRVPPATDRAFDKQCLDNRKWSVIGKIRSPGATKPIDTSGLFFPYSAKLFDYFNLQQHAADGASTHRNFKLPFWRG